MNIRYDKELANDYYLDGKKLADNLLYVYHVNNLTLPN
jgi:hypothetical protein